MTCQLKKIVGKGFCGALRRMAGQLIAVGPMGVLLFGLSSATLTVTASVGDGTQQSKARAAPQWQNLFDGKSLAGWILSDFEFGSSVKVENAVHGTGAAIVIAAGATLSGITWRDGSALPRSHYEITLEAMKLEGEDFFCGLTFPVGKSACTFVVGGWGGTVVGLSSIDHFDASANETTSAGQFELHRWYRILVRVSDHKIEAWIDDEQMVNVETKGRLITLRGGDIQKSLPLGIATYMTRAAIRDIRLRRL